MKIYLGALRMDVSFVGFCSLAEWNCIVSCLRWLIAIVGIPKRKLKVRSCNAEYQKLKPIGDQLRNSIPVEHYDTHFEMEYVVREEDITELYHTSIQPCWVGLFSEAYIGVHIHERFTYSTRFKETETWKGKGLKVGFPSLVHAAGVEEVVDIDGSPILCGFCSALIPIAQFEDGSVQWHLLIARNDNGPFRWIHHRNDFRELLPMERLRNVKIDSLKGTAYVGWHKTGVNIMLSE